MKKTGFAFVLYILMIISPIRNFIESIMIAHMLIQLPLLIFVGWLIGHFIVEKFHSLFNSWNINGVPGMIIVVFITMYWMIPRTLDEALTIGFMEVFKFTSLPVAGVILFDSWRRIGDLGKSFIFLNYLSMFGLMAWLYIDSPIQICNNYLTGQQRILGWGFLIITLAMALYTIQSVFTDHSEENVL
ncbi:hypothetical protein [Oceanobacillus bengalensis]|uniref:DUF1404 domain-containing protein n=1 Tax=Oceanobacillus bengalensis TaxID=1435466 RepID=A0A494Z4Y4_9BACI|nr:hypothetical protein [Oceanobacillus bengalensis]RKQ17559.1 hypothetical protein D8M05_03950 [Oceanobacillus bengalensis]